jgi:hypothetical protein
MRDNTDERDSRFLWGWVIGLTIFSALYRVFPYYFLDAQSRQFWNLAPIGALGLFAGTRLRSRVSLVVPVVAMFLSDLLLIKPLADMNMSAFGPTRPLIYACFVLYAVIGQLLPRGERSLLVLGGAGLLGGAIFFLVSNFLVWPGSKLYPQTLAGLGQCYLAGVPFYRNTVAGDLLFTGLFFGLYAAAEAVRAPRKVRQPA